jgi:hypothetical protein
MYVFITILQIINPRFFVEVAWLLLSGNYKGNSRNRKIVYNLHMQTKKLHSRVHCMPTGQLKQLLVGHNKYRKKLCPSACFGKGMWML